MMNELYHKADLEMEERALHGPKISELIVFSYYYNGETIDLDVRGLKFYSDCLLELKTMVPENNGTAPPQYIIVPYHDKDYPTYTPHKAISRAIWHHDCELLFQALLGFYHQPDGCQLSGYNEIVGLDKGPMYGCKYAAAMEIILRLNGSSRSLEYITCLQSYQLLEFNPFIDLSTHFMMALLRFTTKLDKMRFEAKYAHDRNAAHNTALGFEAEKVVRGARGDLSVGGDCASVPASEEVLAA